MEVITQTAAESVQEISLY